MTIEGVNSVIANSAVARQGTSQIDASRAAAQQNAGVSDSAPVQTPFRSLNVEINSNYDRAVLQVRDSQTGDVLSQFPSETRLQTQSLAQAGTQPSVLSDSNAGQTVRSEVSSGSSSDASANNDVSTGNVALAQVASQALSAASQSGVQSLSAGVSVAA